MQVILLNTLFSVRQEVFETLYTVSILSHIEHSTIAHRILNFSNYVSVFKSEYFLQTLYFFFRHQKLQGSVKNQERNKKKGQGENKAKLGSALSTVTTNPSWTSV